MRLALFSPCRHAAACYLLTSPVPSPLLPTAADEHFRLVYDAKGRFVVHRITKEEASYKLCKVRRLAATRRPCNLVGSPSSRQGVRGTCLPRRQHRCDSWDMRNGALALPF